MRLSLVTLIVVLASSVVAASEKADLYPGEANWHRYRFTIAPAVTEVRTAIAVNLAWDTPETGVLIAVLSVDRGTITAISTGDDRYARLDVGLLRGTYELIVIGVQAPTHYHLTMQGPRLTRGRDGAFAPSTDLFSERLVAERLAPEVAQLQRELK